MMFITPSHAAIRFSPMPKVSEVCPLSLSHKSLQHPKKVVLSMCEQFTKDQLCEILYGRSSYVHIDIEECCRIPVKSVQTILDANLNQMAQNSQVSFSGDLGSMFDQCMHPGWILPEEIE